MDFRILGPVEVHQEGRPLPLGAGHQRALVALLALEANRVVSTDRLIDGLWGENPPPTALAALQGHVSGLRRTLGADVIETRRPGYVLRAAPEDVDVARFDRLREEARAALHRGDAEAAATGLRAALELWRGEPLADVASAPFAVAEAARLEDLRLGAIEDRIDADLALGAAGGLIGELERLVAGHPLRERLRGQLMVALYRAGRQAEALDAYRAARRALVTELGIEPGPALRDLERRVLEHDPSLDAPPRTQAPTAGRAPRGSRRRRAVVAAAVLACAAIAVPAAALLAGEDAPPAVPANAVAIIDPGRDAVTGSVGVGREPGPLAAGLGVLWVLSPGNRTLAQIDPEREALLRSDGVGSDPGNVSATKDDVWVIDGCAAGGFSGTLIHVTNAADGELGLETSLDGAVDQDPEGAVPRTSGEGCGLSTTGRTTWVVTNVPPGIVRVDYDSGTSRARVVRGTPMTTAPAALTVAAGSVWAVETGADAVHRIDPDSGRTLRTIRVGSDPGAIAAGEDALWVVNTGDDTVSRVDVRTGAVRRAISVGDLPAGVAVGAGAVWVANSGDGTVSRIDPATDRVTATIDVGHRPQGVAVAAGRVWVTVRP